MRLDESEREKERKNMTILRQCTLRIVRLSLLSLSWESHRRKNSNIQNLLKKTAMFPYFHEKYNTIFFSYKQNTCIWNTSMFFFFNIHEIYTTCIFYWHSILFIWLTVKHCLASYSMKHNYINFFFSILVSIARILLLSSNEREWTWPFQYKQDFNFFFYEWLCPVYKQHLFHSFLLNRIFNLLWTIMKY